MLLWPDVQGAYPPGGRKCQDRCQQAECAVLQSFDRLLRKLADLRSGSLKLKELFRRGSSSIEMYFGSLSKFPELFIFLSIIGLQNNWNLPRNFNGLFTCESNEEDISVSAKLRK